MANARSERYMDKRVLIRSCYKKKNT